jgi:processive 1,2-diacylglycerol beta-glucosyltransferase
MAKRILLITEEWAGSGHRMAAVAIQEALKDTKGAISSKLVGGLETASPALRELSRLFYLNMLRYGQPIWQQIYNQEHLFGAALERPLGWWLSMRLTNALLREEEPDVVVATHAYCLSALAEAKQRVDKPFHLVSIPTDFHVNRFWVHPGIDTYIVAHEQIAQTLSKNYHVEAKKIRVHGIPIRPVFGMAAKIGKKSWKERLGLSPELFTVLVSGGEGGYGRMDDVLRELMKDAEPLQIVVITGKNEGLRKHLDGWLKKETPRHHVVVKGYEPNIWQWIGAADAYITKPGGISCAEALALKTPLIVYQPLPGQEKHNTAFLLQHQAALFAERLEEITQAIRHWRERQQWEKAIERMEGLRRPESAKQIAKYLLRL